MPQMYMRLDFDDVHAIGPFRVGLLEAIAESASIAAAARAKGLSYKHAWDVLQASNAVFGRPLFKTAKGRRGGAALTPLGEEVVTIYRTAEKRAYHVISKHADALEKLRAPSGRPPAR